MFKIIKNFSKGLRLFFVLSLLASLLNSVFTFLSPQIIRITIDSIIGDQPFSVPGPFSGIINSLGGRAFFLRNLYIPPSLFILFSVCSSVLDVISRLIMTGTTEVFFVRLRNKLFTHIEHLPYSWHIKTQTGDIIQRATSDINLIWRFISSQLTEVIRIIFVTFTATTLMFTMNIQLSLAAIAFIPIIITYSWIFYSKISKKFHEADRAEGELSVVAQENFTGIRVIRAFSRTAREIDKFKEKNAIFASKWINTGNVLGLFWGVGDFVTGMMLLTVIGFGCYLATEQDLTVGQFMVFISYSQMLAWPLRNLGRILGDMSKAGVSAARINEILDTQTELDTPNATQPPLDRDIQFDHVTFGYNPNQSILKDLTMTIKAGTTCALLGGTASGKSTLAYLINGLYTPWRGSVRIGGVDVKDIQLQHLRRHVGFALQEPFLFSRTIGENIAICHPHAAFSDIQAVARIAAFDQSVLQFTDGYETMVGERGVTLSGGQKQRASIARLLMNNPPIMIFDDSLSAVDTETDAKIQAALKEHTRGKTVIIISHRISTVMNADNIFVLEHGKIIQSGTHSQLATQPGIYQKLLSLQSTSADTAS